MIIIKNIEFYEVSRDPWVILSEKRPYEPIYLKGNDSEFSEAVECTAFKELIRGRRFVRPTDGTDIVVGCSKQAQEVLGLMYEAWDYNCDDIPGLLTKQHELEKELDEIKAIYRETNANLSGWQEYARSSTKRLSALLSASFWTRLKWLFTGVKEV